MHKNITHTHVYNLQISKATHKSTKHKSICIQNTYNAQMHKHIKHTYLNNLQISTNDTQKHCTQVKALDDTSICDTSISRPLLQDMSSCLALCVWERESVCVCASLVFYFVSCPAIFVQLYWFVYVCLATYIRVCTNLSSSSCNCVPMYESQLPCSLCSFGAKSFGVCCSGQQ